MPASTSSKGRLSLARSTKALRSPKCFLIVLLICELSAGASLQASCSADSPLQRPPTCPTIVATFIDPPHFTFLYAADLLHLGRQVQGRMCAEDSARSCRIRRLLSQGI